MREQRKAPGEIVYREGDESDAVHFIQSGAVEVFRNAKGRGILLGVLSKGEMFGEMGVVRGIARSTTTRARGPVVLLSLSKQDFLEAIGGENAIGLRILRMLCERLASTDRKLIEAGYGVEPALYSRSGSIRLLPGAPLVERQIGSEGRRIDRLPFRVGQRPLDGKRTVIQRNEILLNAASSVHISPNHFAIDLDGEDVLVVRDLGSNLGTIVNEKRVSRFDETSVAPLLYGPNSVVAGGGDSPYRFEVVVERTGGSKAVGDGAAAGSASTEPVDA